MPWPGFQPGLLRIYTPSEPQRRVLTTRRSRHYIRNNRCNLLNSILKRHWKWLYKSMPTAQAQFSHPSTNVTLRSLPSRSWRARVSSTWHGRWQPSMTHFKTVSISENSDFIRLCQYFTFFCQSLDNILKILIIVSEIERNH